jgi:glucose/arabinose dehydrogenase
VTDELEQPASMAFAGDDMLVTEMASGRVRLVRDGEVVGDAIDLAVNDFDAFTAPVLSYVRPPALTAIGFSTGDRLGGSDTGAVWVGTVLTDSLLRYPLGEDGHSLVLEGDLAEGVDHNESKGDLGESEGHVVGTGFGTVTDIDQGADGDLCVTSLTEGSIFRISPADG